MFSRSETRALRPEIEARIALAVTESLPNLKTSDPPKRVGALKPRTHAAFKETECQEPCVVMKRTDRFTLCSCAPRRRNFRMGEAPVGSISSFVLGSDNRVWYGKHRRCQLRRPKFSSPWKAWSTRDMCSRLATTSSGEIPTPTCEWTPTLSRDSTRAHPQLRPRAH